MQDDETENIPLLGQRRQILSKRARRYLTENIRLKNASFPLLVCCFVTGFIDAGSYNAWSVFMGMQTGSTRRVTLVLSFLVQTLCIAIAAILVHTDAVPESAVSNELVLIAIPFLAAQSGVQIATAKSLGFNEIPTTVLTSVYNDLASDTRLFAWDNPKRNRRLGAFTMLLLGGISAGWLSRTAGRFTVVLWLGAAIKLLLSFGWLLFSADPD
ncbi:MAG: hypothetical protein Q9191_004705 [Dirinaria sp. TL-2023a]